RNELLGFQSFFMDFVEGGNMVVPLQKRCRWANQLNGLGIKLPYRIDYRVIVGIENVFFVLGVSGDVDLGHALDGNALQVFKRIKIMIAGGNVNIVDVEQDAAVRVFHHFVEELPFRHFGDVELGVTAYVFHRDGHFQEIARLTYFLRRAFGGLKRIGHGQKVVRITAIHAAPAQVISKPGSVGAADKFFQPGQMLTIERLSGAEIHGDSVLHYTIAFQNLVQDVERPAAINHEIFGNHFKPVNHRFLFENMIVMRDAQPNADTVIFVSVEAICGHIPVMNRAGEGFNVLKTEDQRPGHRPSLTTERASRYFLSPSFAFSMGLPSVRHSPLPLQSFLPLVVPQPPLPLQEFWPLQACFSFLLLVAFLPLSELVSFLSPPVFWAKAFWPATNPVRAAPISSKRTDLVMCKSPFLFLGTSAESIIWTEQSGGRQHPRQSLL